MSNLQYNDGVPTPAPAQREARITSACPDSFTGTSDHSSQNMDQNEPSSSLTGNDENKNIEEVLSSFRTLWKKEISNEAGESNVKPINEESTDDNEKEIEAKARQFFLLGVENEQKGRLYEAIRYYRKAEQLVPNIEFKLYDARISKDKNSDALDNRGEELEADNLSDDEDGPVDLSLRRQIWACNAQVLCEPVHEQQATHISSLPMEIMIVILRWVVSRDLDIRSLEMCSMVCRGFYVCCRDSEIWRLICLRLWGINCGGLGNYLSWRDMYLKRPHLIYSGCYISRTKYMRLGENSFQDQFYRPWHEVEYFRYLRYLKPDYRFFPEGKVLMMTTPEAPGPSLGHLRHRNSKYPAIIVGHYRLVDDRVVLVLTRGVWEQRQGNNRYRGRQNRQSPELMEQTYNIELQIKTWKGQINSQLVWTRYKVFTRRGATETITNFEIHGNKFPPFYFSRVKSYSAESDMPLI